MIHNRERGDSGEVELANVAAWAAANIRMSPRIKQALESDGKENITEAVMDRVTSAILPALQAKKTMESFSPGGGKTNVLSRVEKIITEDLLLDAKHEWMRKQQLRGAAKKEGRAATTEQQAERQIVKPEDLANSYAENFSLLEESRIANQIAEGIDFERYVANLTPRERSKPRAA